MKKQWMAILGLGLLLASCASDPLQLESEPRASVADARVRTEIDRSFELRPGEVAAVGAGRALVGFRGIRSDSRCPVDVTCVWACDAVAVVGLAQDSGPWQWFDLHTGIEPREASAIGVTVRLEEVEPQARTGGGIAQASYRVTLRVAEP